MRTLPSPRSYLLVFAVILLIGTVVSIQSCRKMDRVAPAPQTLSEREAKFFNSYRSGDTKEKALVDFFKRRNDSSHFVEKAVERIGYPRWDKAISNKEATPTGRSGSNEATITYIPFVRENENHVNASLVVRTAPGDTSFHYLCDWQYSQFGYDTTTTGWNARTVFVLFTKLDHATFGHTKFKITDDSLFAGDKVTATLLPAAPGNMAGRLVPAIECTFYEMVTCIEHTGRSESGNAVEVMFNPCYTWYRSFCTTVWTYEPDMPPGGGGGGGNPPPGDDPPTCHGGPVEAAKPMDPCGPGWEPIPVDDPPVPPLNDTIIAKNLKRLIEKAGNIPDSIHSKAQEDGDERTFTYVRNSNGDTTVMWIRRGASHSSSPTLTGNSFGMTHTHQEDDTTIAYYKNECFDGPDIYKLYKNAAVDGYPLNVSILTTRDYYYAAVITDITKFRNHIKAISGSQNLEEIYQQLSFIHSDAMSSCNIMPFCNWQKKTELGVLSLIANNNAAISGISIFRSPKQNINFTLLTP